MDENTREHKVTIENRERLTVGAVEDVESFDEEKVVILTDMGTMTVSGSDFRINRDICSTLYKAQASLRRILHPTPRHNRCGQRCCTGQLRLFLLRRRLYVKPY